MSFADMNNYNLQKIPSLFNIRNKPFSYEEKDALKNKFQHLLNDKRS